MYVYRICRRKKEYVMTNYKYYLQSRLDRVKHSATELLSRYEEEKSVVELEEAVYERLKAAADEQHTTVQALVNYIVEQHLTHRLGGSIRQITSEQKDENPLLILDGICGNK
jgi:predicted DNA-binding ribbon-helix-helix protein